MQAIADAVAPELRVGGYEGLTVRSVAKRAGVATATAYTYFASKEHLVCEAFWRTLRLRAAESTNRVADSDDLARKVIDALSDFAELAAAEPQLVAACTIAMVADDPDVKLLRDRVGADIHRRFVAALGPDADHAIVEALDLAMTGAMIRAGTGHLPYPDIPSRMAHVACLLVQSGTEASGRARVAEGTGGSDGTQS